MMTPETKISAAQARADLALYRAAHVAAHPGLHYDQTKENWADVCHWGAACDSVAGLFQDSLTVSDYFRYLLGLNVRIGERHSFIDYSSAVYGRINTQAKFLPFTVKIFFDAEETFVLVEYSTDSTLVRGTRIEAINGKLVTEIVSAALAVTPSDGAIYISRLRDLERKFGFYYYVLFGQSDFFSLECSLPLPNGEFSPPMSYNAPGQTRDFIRKNLKKHFPETDNPPPIVLKIDTAARVAVLNVRTFSASAYKRGKNKYRKQLKHNFQAIRNAGVSDLILDLRGNLGGRIGYWGRLMAYLHDRSVRQIHQTIAANFKVRLKTENGVVFRKRLLPFYEQLFIYNRALDGRLYGKGWIYQTPRPAAARFNGKLYVLNDGQTGSAAVMLGAALSNFRPNVTFIGEEAGDDCRAFTAGLYWKLVLPQSKILTAIPLIYFLMEAKNEKIQSHRLTPDYPIAPDRREWYARKDQALALARKLILESR